MSDDAIPPGWYPDGSDTERWWDGRGWSYHTRPWPTMGATQPTAAGGATADAPQSTPDRWPSPQPQVAPTSSGPDAAPARSGRHPLAVTALVLAIAAFVLGLVPLLGFLTWIPAIVAVVLGAVVLARRFGGRGFALTGVILGSVAVLTGLVISGAMVSAVSGATSAATVGPAQEQAYLEAALDAVSVGMGASPLAGDARQAAHEKADAQLLKSGYSTCQEFARDRVSAADAADSFVKGFAKSGGSEADARRVGKTFILTIAKYLCPQRLDEAERVAAAL